MESDICRMEGSLNQDYQVENGKKNRRLGTFYVLLLGLIANLGCVSPGMTLGFSAVAIPQMTNTNATFYIDGNQASWMASLASISTAVGCLVSGSIMDRFGRKMAIVGLNIPGLAGWLLIAFAQGSGTLGMVYAGRILTGLATGMCSSPAAVYSAEIASSGKIRGMMVTWTSLAVALGILLVYILGYFIDNWRLIAGITAIIPVIAFILGYIFLPESPAWLTNKGRHKEAADVKEKLHGPTLHYETPLTAAGYQKPQGSLLKAFFKSSFLRPFVIMNLFFFFQQFSGVFVIVFYAVDIIIEAGIDFDPYLIAVLIGVTRFVVTIAVSVMSKNYGRRPLAIISGSGMILCMGCLATYVYLQSSGYISEEWQATLSWVPVLSLVMYILTSTIGFLTLPWAMVGEVYPTRVRGIAAGLTTCLAYMYNFIIIKIYPSMVHTLDRYGLFFFYGAVSIIGTIFVVIFLPETRGKNLADIELQYKKSKGNNMEEVCPLKEVGNRVVIAPARRA